MRQIVLLAFVLSATAVPARASAAAQTHALHALLLERQGAYAEALAEYQQAAGLDPHSAYLCRRIAELAVELGDWDTAGRWSRKALEIEPQSAETLTLMGRVLWSRGEVEEARADFEQALKLDPTSAETVFTLANLLGARKPDDARRLLEKFLAENPQSAGATHEELAKLAAGLGRLDDAIVHFQKAIQLNPDEAQTVPARYALAQAYEAQRDTSAALGVYLGLVKFEPENPALFEHLGELYTLMGSTEAARERFLETRRLLPSEPNACNWLALDAESHGDFSRAADYLKASAALPEEPVLNLRLSYDLTQAGHLPEAVKTLEAASLRWPDNDQIAYFLALGYDDLKQEEKAIAALRHALAIKPKLRDARYQLAVIFEKTGRMEECEKEFRLLLSHYPNDASALNYLGYSLADRALKLDVAEELIRRAVHLEPNNGAYQDSLGWVLFKKGRPAEALKELEAAADKDGADETVFDHIAQAQTALGDLAGAWRTLKKAQMFAAHDASLAAKAERAAARLSPEVLGAAYLDLWAQAQGPIAKLSGLGEIHGTVLGQSFSYPMVMTYTGSDTISLDLLGPMFTPLMKLRLIGSEFAMEPSAIEGVSPQALHSAASALLTTIRDVLSGRLYAQRPARVRKSWHGQWIETPNAHIEIDAAGLRPAAVTNSAAGGQTVTVEDFPPASERAIARVLRVSGKGYTFELQLKEIKVQ